MKDKMIVFGGKRIRRVWHEDEWWFSIVDIIEILTNSRDPRRYLKDMRRRDDQLSEGWVKLPPPSSSNKKGGSNN